MRAKNLFSDKISSLFLIQLFSVIPFASILFSIGTYLTENNLNEVFVSQISATYISINFILHWLSSYLINTLINVRYLLMLSLLLSAIGCFILSLHNYNIIYFIYGLSIQLCGNGLSITCIYSLLNNNTQKLKSPTFLYNYSYLNIGFLIGVFLSGYALKTNHYTQIFLLCGISSTIALILTYKKYKNIKINLIHIRGTLLILCLIPLIQYLLKNTQINNTYIIIILIFTVFYFLRKIKISYHDYSEKNQTIILILTSSLIFWTIYNLKPITLIFFIKNYVNTSILGFNIAPQWFEIINNILIIIIGPIIAKKIIQNKYNKYNFQKLFALSLGLSSIGMLTLLIGIEAFTPIGEKISPIWLIIKTIFESLGEIIIFPIGLAALLKLTNKKFNNIAIGSWLLINGAAAAIANIFIKISSQIYPTSTTPSLSYYSHTMFLGVSIGLVCCLILVISSTDSKQNVI